MSEVRTIPWESISEWFAKHEQTIRDVMKFEGLRGAVNEVLRLAPDQPELAALREENRVLQKQLGDRWSDISALKETVDRQDGEVAALRGDLAKRAGDIGSLAGERDSLREEADQFRESSAQLAGDLLIAQQRLADAERRNAELAELLKRAKPYIPWSRFGSVQYQWNLEVKDALNKPEEAKS